MNLRNIALGLTLILGSFGLANGQCTYLNGCQPDGDEIACPNGMNNCCQVWNACNGPSITVCGTMTLTFRGPAAVT